jgi:hypothetical protein
MAFNTDVRNHISIPESGKFVEITDDTRFPHISVQRTYPNGSIETAEFSKYAVLTYDIGAANSIVNGSPFGDNGSVDAFGRLRVSNPKTLFDAKQLVDKLPQFFDEVIGGSATSTFVPGDSLTIMRTVASGDYAIRQTSMHFNYQPGKSIVANFTGVFEPELNIIKRIGLFQGLSTAPYTPSDGIFIESLDGPNGYIAFKVLKTAGTPLSLSAAQPDWNIDRLDGTGPSGFALDFRYAQLMIIDYEWLGVGRVRCGFYINGRPVYCHAFSNYNSLSAPFMTSGNQPVRYEIRQTGAGSGYLKHICSSVMSEGGEQYIGTSLTAEMSSAVAIVDTAYRPLLAIRLNPTSHNLALVVKNIHVLNVGVNDGIFKAVLNPTITGGSLSFRDLSYSPRVQFANGSAAVGLSGGFDLASNYAGKGNSARAAGTGDVELLGELSVLGTKINGTPDVLVIAARGVGGSTSMYAAVDVILRA